VKTLGGSGQEAHKVEEEEGSPESVHGEPIWGVVLYER